MTIKFSYERIVAYGCSITAGEELSTLKILNMSYHEVKEIIKKNNLKYNGDLLDFLKIDNITRDKIRESNAKLSWPNYIGEYFGIDTVNRAIGGSSLKSVLYYISKDYYYKKILPTDLVLVGVTSPTRWFQFAENGHHIHGIVGANWVARYDKYYKDILEKYYFNYYTMFNEHSMLLNSLATLSFYHKNQIKLTTVLQGLDEFQHVIDESNDDQLKEFYKFCINQYSKENFLNSKFKIMDHSNIENLCPFSHPSLESHKLFADSIIKDINQKLLNGNF
jgi:hypothetical protein